MTNGMSTAVQGYVKLGTWLVGAWGEQAAKVASHLDAGNPEAGLIADQATADLADGLALAFQSLALIANEALDAAAVLGPQRPAEPTISDVFSTTVTGKHLAGIRKLKLAGPLVSDVGGDSLPVSSVRIVPNELKDGETDFQLEADTAGHRAVAYSGKVEMVDTNGVVLESIAVWLSA